MEGSLDIGMTINVHRDGPRYHSGDAAPWEKMTGGPCLRGGLFFASPTGIWSRGTCTLVIGGDTNARLPIEATDSRQPAATEFRYDGERCRAWVRR